VLAAPRLRAKRSTPRAEARQAPQPPAESGVVRRCPQTWVRAKRSTLRAAARQAPQPPAESGVVRRCPQTWVRAQRSTLRAAARQAPQPPAESGVVRRCPQTWVRAQRSTLRAAARAKQLSRMPGTTSTFLTLARSDHDFRMRWRPTRTDRTGACFPQARRDRPSGHQPRLRKRKSPTARVAPRVLTQCPPAPADPAAPPARARRVALSDMNAPAKSSALES
jgi:hypothetical protein